jgi:predicted naringenin-chalcone synthase
MRTVWGNAQGLVMYHQSTQAFPQLSVLFVIVSLCKFHYTEIAIFNEFNLRAELTFQNLTLM